MTTIRRLSLPMRKAEDVIPYLGKPGHWKQGRSAKSLADIWFQANDVPPAVRRMLHQSDEFLNCELVDAWLERSTNLDDGRSTHSQTDLLAVLGLKDGLAILGIEAKVDESFGPLVSEWLRDDSIGKRARLARLLSTLGIDEADAAPLRYQLLHRTVAAIIEAKRYRSNHAVMLVQSFCPKATGFDDFAAFCRTLGHGDVQRDCLPPPRRIDGVMLWLGWASDEVPPGYS